MLWLLMISLLMVFAVASRRRLAASRAVWVSPDETGPGGFLGSGTDDGGGREVRSVLADTGGLRAACHRAPEAQLLR